MLRTVKVNYYLRHLYFVIYCNNFYNQDVGYLEINIPEKF